MTQFALKLIALVSMLLDHTAKVLPVVSLLSPSVGMETAIQIRDAMLILGRIAFPIFAWFAAEGCRKTSSMGKYVLRLAVFGILSEAQFQLCFYGPEVSLGCHNVIFTILLAALAVWAGKALADRGVPELVSALLPALVAISLGWVLHTDYNAWGVALILGLYYMPVRKGQLLWLSAWVTVFQLIWHGWNGSTLSWLSSSGSILLLYWLGAMVGVALLAAYNDQRGPKVKWLFYVFYPAHLLLLLLVRSAL